MKTRILRHKTVFIVIGIVIIVAIAFSAGLLTKSSTADSASFIGIENAKKAALSNAGLNESSVKFIRLVLDKDDSVPNYDIDFKTSSASYEYEIDAVSGTVLDKASEALVPAGTIGAAAPSTSSTVSATTSPDTNASKSTVKYIGIAKAKTLAKKHAGVSGASFKEAYLDTENGTKVYELEFTSGGKEYEYEINASTGKIVSDDWEYCEGNSSNQGSNNGNSNSSNSQGNGTTYHDDDYDNEHDDYDYDDSSYTHNGNSSGHSSGHNSGHNSGHENDD